MTREEVIQFFPVSLGRLLGQAPWDPGALQEIRLRIGKPFLLLLQGKEYFITPGGYLTHHSPLAYRISERELQDTLEHLSQYSLYAYEEELRQGFLTIQGGHRVGVAGKVIVEDHKVKNIYPIGGINIRFSHQIKGCADPVLPYVLEEGQVCHTLILSPPRCGKTTLLRDLIRQLSDGFRSFPGQTVGVVDERSEIGGCFRGIPQNDLGIRTDVLDCCPKAEGMMMLLRSMAPQILAVDEIGSYEDIDAIEATIHSGCKLLATIHGDSIAAIRQKPLLERLMQEHVFQRYVVLGTDAKGREGKRTGRILAVYDDRGTCLTGSTE